MVNVTARETTEFEISFKFPGLSVIIEAAVKLMTCLSCALVRGREVWVVTECDVQDFESGFPSPSRSDVSACSFRMRC